MPDLIMSAWTHAIDFASWLAASSFWPQFFATAIGAWVAFRLEHNRRERERIDNECTQANALIATLGRLLTVLENVRETISPLQSEGSTASGLTPIRGLPQNPPRIELASLAFMLATQDQNDRLSRVYGRLSFAQEQFDTLLEQLQERNQLIAELRSIGKFIPLGDAGVSVKARKDEIIALLYEFALELPQECEARVSLFKEVVGQARKAAEYRYPKRQFLGLYSMTDHSAPRV